MTVNALRSKTNWSIADSEMYIVTKVEPLMN